MIGYLEFRRMLSEMNLDYDFDDETNTYWVWSGRHRIVPIPSRIAWRDVSAARDLIDTALSLHALFES